MLIGLVMLIFPSYAYNIITAGAFCLQISLWRQCVPNIPAAPAIFILIDLNNR